MTPPSLCTKLSERIGVSKATVVLDAAAQPKPEELSFQPWCSVGIQSQLPIPSSALFSVIGLTHMQRKGQRTEADGDHSMETLTASNREIPSHYSNMPGN